MDEASVKASVRYTFAGMRGDGCMPDRVQIDGMSVMAPGRQASSDSVFTALASSLVLVAQASGLTHGGDSNNRPHAARQRAESRP